MSRCEKCVFSGECLAESEDDPLCEGFASIIIEGMKADSGKVDWYALPLEILEPLAAVMRAGEQKYGTFNCLEQFKESNRRFWSANMRHAVKCQQDPLAIDEETGCYHEACRAFSSLMRIYHAKKERGIA